MARVKLGFSRLSVGNKLITAKWVVTCMTGNAYYPSPDPDLQTVSAAIDTLDRAAQQALKGGTDKTLAKNIAEDELLVLMNQLQSYVQMASGGRALVIESSGMGVENGRTPASLPQAIQNPRATVGGNPGEIELSWGSAKIQKSYVVEMKNPNVKTAALPPIADPVEDQDVAVITDASTKEWIRIDTVTRPTMTVKGLTTGTVYSFRIAAVNSAGQGAYSQVVSSVAP